MLASSFVSLSQLRHLPANIFYITVNGRLTDANKLTENDHFQVHFRLLGGKGGFGSLLRSFRIHRSANQLMCRDLSGRRLADIKDEEKLRKWIERSNERAEEKKRKRLEKYQKLKAGAAKHQMDDPEYIRTRNKILDQTDEAFDAGLAELTSSNQKTGKSNASDSENKVGEEISIGKNLKRRASGESIVPEKKTKVGESDPGKESCSVDDGHDSVICQSSLNENMAADKLEGANVKKIKHNEGSPTKKSTPSCIETFEEIDLENFTSAESLESLGLAHLKHALEARGMKCGGSVKERALRLFSVKGLEPKDYPKSVRALSGMTKRK